MEQTLNPPVRSALAITALAYLPSVLAMMSVGVIVPFIDTLCHDLATLPAQIGLAIALFSVPSAVLATVGGGLIDTYGIRRSMLLAAAASTAGSLLASQASSLLMFDSAMLIAGVGFGGMCVASPCLVMATLTDAARIRAMSFVSTFAPTGYAAGLLLAVPFAGGGSWRVALFLHAALMAGALVTLALCVPDFRHSSAIQMKESPRARLGSLLAVFRDPRALRLGIAVALPNAVSYGTSLSAPSYLARAHHLSIATSSASVALAKLAAMIIGGLSMGYLLSRAVAPKLLFAVMVVIGLLAQMGLYLSTTGIALPTGSLVVWLFAFGGMAGGAMTLLPSVARDPARGGAISGLVNQFISLASFAAPSTWLALQEGTQYVLLAAACLAISLIALPGAARS
jgi:predicted MFS family arabinose efflux permease